MSCPRLSQLPVSPSERAGWPWTEESPQLPDTMPDGRPWPRITMVTVNYNYGRYIEQTLRSVLLQGYPNLEYIVIDGSSTDTSVEIIQKYAPWLAYWESKPDRGQSHAINKGFEHATGDIYGWINSDDMLAKSALETVGRTLPLNGAVVLSGACQNVDEAGVKMKCWQPERPTTRGMLERYGMMVAQPSTFWTRDCWGKAGPLNEQLHYGMDYDLFLKFSVCASDWKISPAVLSIFRRHERMKTWKSSAAYCWMELRSIIKSFASSPYYRKEHRKSLWAARFFFGWLRFYEGRHYLQRSAWPSFGDWLLAPASNPLCLLTPDYYRRLARALRRK
jgi:glycosyltransferase involved in cell wall biosynthesis